MYLKQKQTASCLRYACSIKEFHEFAFVAFVFFVKYGYNLSYVSTIVHSKSS